LHKTVHTFKLDFQQFNFFQLTLQLRSLTATLCSCLSKHIYCATAAAAAVVQSRLHEPYSVYYFASFYVRQKVSCSFVHHTPATPLCASVSRQQRRCELLIYPR